MTLSTNRRSHYHLSVRVFCYYLFEGFNTCYLWHDDIHENHVRLELLIFANSLLAVGCFINGFYSKSRNRHTELLRANIESSHISTVISFIFTIDPSRLFCGSSSVIADDGENNLYCLVFNYIIKISKSQESSNMFYVENIQTSKCRIYLQFA